MSIEILEEAHIRRRRLFVSSIDGSAEFIEMIGVRRGQSSTMGSDGIHEWHRGL